MEGVHLPFVAKKGEMPIILLVILACSLDRGRWRSLVDMLPSGQLYTQQIAEDASVQQFPGTREATAATKLQLPDEVARSNREGAYQSFRRRVSGIALFVSSPCEHGQGVFRGIPSSSSSLAYPDGSILLLRPMSCSVRFQFDFFTMVVLSARCFTRSQSSKRRSMGTLMPADGDAHGDMTDARKVLKSVRLHPTRLLVKREVVRFVRVMTSCPSSESSSTRPSQRSNSWSNSPYAAVAEDSRLRRF